MYERIENWQKKKEANINRLAHEIRSKEEVPSFRYSQLNRPKIEDFKPEIVKDMPEDVRNDRFMLQGVAEYLRRQQKAREKSDHSREKQSSLGSPQRSTRFCGTSCTAKDW